MAINGLGYDLMSAYNRIGFNDRIDAVPVVKEPVKTEEAKPSEKTQEELTGVKVNLNFDSIRRRPAASLEDISKDFSKKDSLKLEIDEQSMKSDMDRAVAAMEKDSSLKQYQYFVGDTNIITDDEDGLVFVK